MLKILCFFAGVTDQNAVNLFELFFQISFLGLAVQWDAIANNYGYVFSTLTYIS